MMMLDRILIGGLLLACTGLVPPPDLPDRSEAETLLSILIDDFESYQDRGLPTKWKYLYERSLVDLKPEYMRDNEKFFVVQERNNNVLRVYTDGEAVHLTMANEPEGFDWDVRTHPRLRWRWRAHRLPEGAREDKDELNDTGIALYVYFSIGGFLIPRPKAIKYTYSSTLPVGTVVTYGKMRVIVVASGADGMGEWMTIERDVVADYRQYFGDAPPDRPLSIRLWGDSDNTNTVAEADFDDIELRTGNE
jgi:hypothetical protein